MRLKKLTRPTPNRLLRPTRSRCRYPVEALPPTIRAAVTSYQQYGQQPISLVASSALSVAALTTQGLANVGRDSNLVGPISLNLAVIAESGERKTSADRRMKRPAQRWQENFRTSHVAEVAEAEARVAAWHAEREGILAKIKTAAGGKPTKNRLDLAELKLALGALELASLRRLQCRLSSTKTYPLRRLRRRWLPDGPPPLFGATRAPL